MVRGRVGPPTFRFSVANVLPQSVGDGMAENLSPDTITRLAAAKPTVSQPRSLGHDLVASLFSDQSSLASASSNVSVIWAFASSRRPLPSLIRPRGSDHLVIDGTAASTSVTR